MILVTLKYISGIRTSTGNVMLYWEPGQYSLEIIRQKKVEGYWQLIIGVK